MTHKDKPKAVKPLDQLKKEAEAHCWQDISTAPKDGTRILAECFKGKYQVVRWETQWIIPQWVIYGTNDTWIRKIFPNKDGVVITCQPTHWKPLGTPDNDIIKDLLATIEVMEKKEYDRVKNFVDVVDEVTKARNGEKDGR